MYVFFEKLSGNRSLPNELDFESVDLICCTHVMLDAVTRHP